MNYNKTSFIALAILLIVAILYFVYRQLPETNKFHQIINNFIQNKPELPTPQEPTPNPEPNPEPNPSSIVPITRGVYVATKWDKPIPDYVLQSEDVDGIFYRLKWSKIEKTQGNYNWTNLNKELAKIKSANLSRANDLQVSIGIATGTETPSYIYNQGVTKLEFKEFRNNGEGNLFDVTIAPPWEEGYMTAYKNLMISLKENLVVNNFYDLVSIIKLTPFARDTAETRLPAQVLLKSKGQVSTNAMEIWQSVGYNEQLLADTWISIGDFVMNLYPEKNISMAIIPKRGFLKITDKDFTHTLIEISAQKWPKRFIVQWNALMDNANNFPTEYINSAFNLRTQIGLQIEQSLLSEPSCLDNGSACDEQMFKNVFDTGIANHMQFIEIFEENVKAYPQAIKYGHDKLLSH